MCQIFENIKKKKNKTKLYLKKKKKKTTSKIIKEHNILVTKSNFIFEKCRVKTKF